METRTPIPSRTSKDKRFPWILLILLLALTAGTLFLLVKGGRLPQSLLPKPGEKPIDTAQPEEKIQVEVVRKPIPSAEPAPSPPPSSVSTYPEVPPQTSQDERKEAFGLKSSVDHIVQSQEPFSVHGRQWTIEDIQKRLASQAPRSRQEMSPAQEGASLGGFLQKPLPAKQDGPSSQKITYYGVRLVRSGENLWEIHYGVVREYFARRGVDLPHRADEPRADGRSTGVGRLLKFLESIVHVYDSRQNRLVENLHLLHPNDLIVFFNISEVFGALDQVNPEDLDSLRYLGPTLQLKAPSKSRVLLNRKDLKDQLKPPGPEVWR